MNEITPSDNDGLNLSGVIRKMLLDDVQVKTRNLFEVAGRYQLPPVRLDEEYFQKVLARGIEGQLGNTRAEQGQSLTWFFRSTGSILFRRIRAVQI